MGIRVLAGKYDGSRDGAALVDSVTETVFGPLLRDADEAEAFLAWLEEQNESDARLMDGDRLAALLVRFRRRCDHRNCWGACAAFEEAK